MLGRYGDTDVDVVDDQITGNNFTFFLPSQFMEDFLELFPKFAVQDFSAVFGHKNDVIFTIPA